MYSNIPITVTDKRTVGPTLKNTYFLFFVLSQEQVLALPQNLVYDTTVKLVRGLHGGWWYRYNGTTSPVVLLLYCHPARRLLRL